MAPLDILSKLTLLLFIGLIVGIIAKKMRIPSMLALIVTGVALSNFTVNGSNLIFFNSDFLLSAAILALVMILFKDSSNFTLHELDAYTESAFKVAVLFLILNMFFLSMAVHFLFSINNVLLSLLFAALMSGTDPGTVLSLFHSKSNKVTDVLKFESVINTPIIVLIPFLILDLMEFEQGILINFTQYLFPFLQQIITGIGAGVSVGIVVFRFMRKFYSQKLSPLTLITSALMTYILAENLGGNGVLAVTVLGVFFGNVNVKKKEELQDFSTMLTNTLEIFVFILIGFMLPLKFDILFLLKSLYLFIVMILIRFVTIHLIYLHDHINLKEQIFMALNCAKGIAVAVVAFMLSNFILEIPVIGSSVTKAIPLIEVSGMQTVLDLIVLFILYSVILSSIAARFSKTFIRLKIEEES